MIMIRIAVLVLLLLALESHQVEELRVNRRIWLPGSGEVIETIQNEVTPNLPNVVSSFKGRSHTKPKRVTTTELKCN